MNATAMMRLPSAFLPVALSAASLATVLGHIAIFGVARQPDEGTAAHIFQILMIVQLPITAFFAIKWLRQEPRRALLILAIQAGAAIAALSPVFALNL